MPEEYGTEYSGAQPGARLAEARAALKLSTGDVARQLKLSVAQVEALEGGQFDSLPGPVFVRGFIRNYARLVKLDPDDLLRTAAHSLPQHAPRPEVPVSQDIPFPSGRPHRWRKYAWLFAILIAAAAAYEFVVSTDETVVTTHPIEVTPPAVPRPPNEKKPLALLEPPSGAKADVSSGSETAPVESAGAMAPEGGSTTQAGEKTAAEPAKPTAEPPMTVATTAPAPEQAATTRSVPEKTSEPKAPTLPPGVDAAPASTAAKSAETRPAEVAPAPAPTAAEPAKATDNPAERRVMLEFEDESWVEIRDRDGKLLLFQLNLPGTRQVVRGLPPLSFVIGNAHGVRLTYDDRAVDLERHTKTDVARLTLE